MLINGRIDPTVRGMKKTAKKKKAAGKAPAKKKATKKKAPAGKKKKVVKIKPPDAAWVKHVLKYLDREYPEVTTALDWDRPLELLLATILSAQCTDERVNMVTPVLFEKYPEAEDVAAAPREEIEQVIHSTGFFRAKAKSIQGACEMIAEEHGGEVPAQMDLLVKLPGVARKTANVVLGTAFGIAEGVVVDTHVKRLSNRLEFSAQQDPKKIEQDLMAFLPREKWINTAHQLILHGRALCKARKPACADCGLASRCPSAE